MDDEDYEEMEGRIASESKWLGKTFPTAHLSSTHATRTGVRSNPDIRGQRPRLTA
jgi:hypothetical protein